MLQVAAEILGDDVQLPRVLLGLLGLTGLRGGAGEEHERGGLRPSAGYHVDRLLLRGLGLLPRHRVGPGQCMCVSLRHKRRKPRVTTSSLSRPRRWSRTARSTTSASCPRGTPTASST